jgi:ATP-dependent helicase IRC3
VAISLPPGSGKTHIFAELIPLVTPPADLPSATRVLVLVQRKELLDQTISVIRKTLPHLRVKAEVARHADVQGADVVVASVASLGRAASESRRARFKCEDFKLVLIDEAHHTTSDTHQRILQHLNVVEPADASSDRTGSVTTCGAAGKGVSLNHTPLVLGCSATMFRHDGVALDMYEEIVFHRPLSELVEAGYLAPHQVKRVYTPDLAHVGIRYGDYSLTALSAMLNTPQHNAMVVDNWRLLARERKSTLVFCVGVNHMKALTAEFHKQGVNARPISGCTSDAERAQTLRDFSAGLVPVLLNVTVFTEGTDLPCIDCIVFSRATKSQGLFQQMRGRGLRLYPGKKDCLCLDFVGNFERLETEGEPLLTGMAIPEPAEPVKVASGVTSNGREEAAYAPLEQCLSTYMHYVRSVDASG